MCGIELMQLKYYFYCALYNRCYTLRLSCYHLRAKIQEGLGALRKVIPGGGTYMGQALEMVCVMHILGTCRSKLNSG